MDRFAQALAALASILGEPMPPERLRGYCAVLDHYNEGQLVSACKALAQSSKFFPKPVEFIDYIESGDLPGVDQQSAAAEAWGRVQSVLSNCSAITGLCYDDSRIAAGIAALNGWYSMLHSDEEPKWQRKTFIAAFCGCRAAERRLLLAAGRDDDSEAIAELCSGIANKLTMPSGKARR